MQEGDAKDQGAGGSDADGGFGTLEPDFDFGIDDFAPPAETSVASPPPARPQRTLASVVDAPAADTPAPEMAQGCCDECGFMEAEDRMNVRARGGGRRVYCSECLPSAEPERVHGFEVAWIPEMSHADVSHLCRVIAVAVWRHVRNKTDDMRAKPVPDVFAELAERVKVTPAHTKDPAAKDEGRAKDYLAMLLEEDNGERENGSPFMGRDSASAMLLASADAARAVYASLKERIGVARSVLGTSDPAEVMQVLGELPDDYRGKALGAIRYIPLEVPFDRIRSWAEVGSFRDVIENGEVSA